LSFAAAIFGKTEAYQWDGPSCSPIIATSSLNIGDRRDTIELVQRAQLAPPEEQEVAWSKAESTKYLFRKMDDMTWFGNREAYTDLLRRLAKDENGEPFLTLKEEIVAYAEDEQGKYGIRFNMCDAAFSVETGRLQFQLYDKARDMGDFSQIIIRYSKADSLSPRAILPSVLTGQLSRIYSVSQKPITFVFDALRVLLRLQGNGFSYVRLCNTIQEIKVRQLPYLDWGFDAHRAHLAEAFKASETVFAMYSDMRGYRRMVFQGVQNAMLELHLGLVQWHLGWQHELPVDVVPEEVVDMVPAVAY
jgi:hypothetical protein